MRETFYQNAGNPIQQDRVPKNHQPTFEIELPLPSLRSSLTLILKWYLIFVVIHFTVHKLSLWGIDWFEPSLTAISWGILAVFAGLAVVRRNAEVILHWRCLAAAIVICLSSSTPRSILALLCILPVGWYAYSFGNHWLTLASSAPLPLPECQTTRKIGRPILLILSLTLCALQWAGYLGLSTFPVHVTWLALSTIGGFVAFFWWRTPGDVTLLMWMTMRSWLTYTDSRAPGICGSPAGCRKNRHMLTLAATTLMLIGRTTMDPIGYRLVWVLWSWILKQWCQETPSGDVIFDISYGSWLLLNIAVDLSYVTISMFSFMAGAFAVNLPVIAWVTWTSYRWRKLEADAKELLNLESSDEEPASTIADLESRDGFGKPIPIQERFFKNITQPAGQFYNQHLLRMKDRLREGNVFERDSILLGFVVSDHSPVLFPKSALKGHAHFLGSFAKPRPYGLLTPFVEQLADQGECSIIQLDMEGSSPEMAASLNAARAFVQDKKGGTPPVAFFSVDPTIETQAFNPFTQPFWKKLSPQCQSDLLISAMGLAYSVDGREGFSSTASRSFGDQGARRQPESFVELLEALQGVAKSAKRHGLNPEVVRAGSQVLELLKRLANVEALNVTAQSGHDEHILKRGICLESILQKPSVAYFHLPSIHDGSTSSTIGRLITELLLEAAARSKPKHPVYLVINEFQRMLMGNLQQVLTRARQLGIRVILNNQVLADLRTRNFDLVPTIEACCRTQIWASVHAREDQERVMASSGVTVEQKTTKGWSWNLSGQFTRTWSTTEETVPIIINNDLNLMNDHPRRYLLKLRSGHGYAQYGGMPVIFESEYHILPEEYERRLSFPWPAYLGSFLPRANWQEKLIDSLPPTTLPGIGPWSQETIGGRPSAQVATDVRSVQEEMLAALLADLEGSESL